MTKTSDTKPSAESELKACPFCGCQPVIEFDEHTVCWMKCGNNDCSIQPHAVRDTKEESIEDWNTRHADSAEVKQTLLAEVLQELMVKLQSTTMGKGEPYLFNKFEQYIKDEITKLGAR